MNAEDIAEGRRVLAALTPGPYRLSDNSPLNRKGYEIEPVPAGHIYGMRRIEDARAIVWLLEHAEELVALAERVAGIEVQSTAKQRKRAQRLQWDMQGWRDGFGDVDYEVMTSEFSHPLGSLLLADATALASLIEEANR